MGTYPTDVKPGMGLPEYYMFVHMGDPSLGIARLRRDRPLPPPDNVRLLRVAEPDPEVVEISQAGPVLDEDGCRVSATFTDHGGITTLCYRVEGEGRRVIISGDGLPLEDFEDFARGADLMVYECSGTAEFLAQQPWGTWHITPEALGDLATRCGVQRLMIKHLVMEDITGDLQAVDDMGERIRRNFDGQVMVGADGMVVDLGRG